jgi:predicted nucleic acid-binding protein
VGQGQRQNAAQVAGRVGPLELSDLPDGALVLVDSAPIIYVLEDDRKFAPRFRQLFELQDAGAIRFAVTTITIAEVLTGPLKVGEEALAKRYRAVMESWQVVSLTADIAESAARFRASLGLRIADAIQIASATAVNADALVTHDRDFTRVKNLTVLA